MAICFVFTPANPKLYTLNASAWLVLSLCDGRSAKAIGDGYAATLIRSLPRDRARAEARAALQDLLSKGVVVRGFKRTPQARSPGSVQRERREHA